MPSYTATQKNSIAQFISFANTPEKTAIKLLKSQNWNVAAAVDAYFQTAPPAPSGPVSASSTTALNKIFDKYHDSVNDPPDTIGVSGSMAYIQDLKLSLEEVTVLAVLEMLQAPTIGEFARAPFVEGWKSTPASADSITKQQGEVQKLRSKLGSDNELFKRVYKYTFIVARNPGQKSVALESAIDYWRLLFSQPHGRAWRSKNAPWLDLWITFLQEKWQKSVNRDMWNMTYQFYEKSMEDESMAWWTLNAAWPGVIDDFVGYVKEHRGNEGDKMEIDS